MAIMQSDAITEAMTRGREVLDADMEGMRGFDRARWRATLEFRAIRVFPGNYWCDYQLSHQRRVRPDRILKRASTTLWRSDYAERLASAHGRH